MCNQVAWLQHGLTLRRVPGQDVKVRNRNTPLALGSAYMNGGFERGHCHVHVRRIRSNAMFARAEDSQTPICSSDRRATRAGLALVAWHIGSAEIHAPRPLQQIASSRRHVAKLRRRTAQ